jgi:drug/metabolite transporter (DMT)-like permease
LSGTGDPRARARERLFAELGVLVVMVLWAGNFIVVKGAVGILPPVAFTVLRYGLASLSLLAILRWREGSFRLPHGDILSVALLGVIGFGVYQMLWTVALQTIPAGDSALLIATTPVMTALLAMAVRADTPSPVKLAGAIISFVGVALVVAAGQGLNLSASLGGDLLTLGASACWAVYTVFGATILRRHSPLVTTTWSVVAGTLFMIPVGLAQLVTVDPSTIGPSVVFAVAYAGLLAAGFANVIVLNGVKLLGPTRVSALQILVPALAVVLAAIFLGEQIRPVQVAGGVVILAGLVLVRRGAWPGRTVREIVPVSEPGP